MTLLENGLGRGAPTSRPSQAKLVRSQVIMDFLLKNVGAEQEDGRTLYPVSERGLDRCCTE